jgi:hypothetical protein
VQISVTLIREILCQIDHIHVQFITDHWGMNILNVAEYESLNLHNLIISIRQHDVSETMLITIQLENHANSSTDLKKKSSNQKVNK